MKRVEVFQFSTWSRTPVFLRRMTDEFLDFIVGSVRANHPFLPLLRELFGQIRPVRSVTVEEALGGGGPAHIGRELRTLQSEEFHWIMRDGFRDDERARFLNDLAGGGLDWSGAAPAPEKPSLGVMINSFHRFSGEESLRRLRELAERHDGLLIGEGNNKSLRQVIGMTLIVPLFILLTSPFIKPFRWSRLFWTYVIPALPFLIVWDGVAALFRLHTPEQLLELARRTGRHDYRWRAGKLPNNRGGFIIYLLGSRR
ncbi:MAG: hypothetical protein KF802_04935 [Bdellovibrionaceae bacterium]|nr:hypothetical protein [Pseudobdellovibrionaceae bacterium]